MEKGRATAVAVAVAEHQVQNFEPKTGKYFTSGDHHRGTPDMYSDILLHLTFYRVSYLAQVYLVSYPTLYLALYLGVCKNPVPTRLVFHDPP